MLNIRQQPCACNAYTGLFDNFGGADEPKYEPFDNAAWFCNAGGIVIRIIDARSIFKMVKRDYPLEGHYSVEPDQAKQVYFA